MSYDIRRVINTEAAFRTQLLARMFVDCHMSRVESPLVSAGFPDINVCIQGHELSIELKYTSTKAAPKVRQSQVIWFGKRVAAGGSPYMLTWIGSTVKKADPDEAKTGLLILHSGRDVGKLAKMTTAKQWVGCCLEGWVITDNYPCQISRLKDGVSSAILGHRRNGLAGR